MTISFGPPLAPDASLFDMRQAIRRLDQEAWAYRKDDLRPLHHALHPPGAKAPAPAGAGRSRKRRRFRFIKSLAGAIAIARALRPRWQGQTERRHPACRRVSAVRSRTSPPRLAGKTAVNLNFTTGRAGMESAAAQAGLKTLITSREFLAKGKIEPPGTLELDFPRRREGGHQAA